MSRYPNVSATHRLRDQEPTFQARRAQFTRTEPAATEGDVLRRISRAILAAWVAGQVRVLARGDTVVVAHHEKKAVTLRGSAAADFLDDVGGEMRQVMARATGDYKRGNERTARDHPRNR